MERKYTATVYTNSHVISSYVGNDLSELIPSLLVLLDNSNSGSYGTIIDNHCGRVIQHFHKRVIDD